MEGKKLQKEKNTTKSTKNNIVGILLIIVLIVVTILSYYAYSRYTSTLTGNGTATVAKWSFIVKINSQEITDSFSLAQTRTDDKKDTIDPSTIAPGTNGILPIELDGSKTEVSVSYKVNLNFTNKPKNFHIYKDSNCEEEIFIENNTNTLAGQAEVGDYVAYNEGTGYTYIASGEQTGTLDAINSEDVERNIRILFKAYRLYSI